MILLSKNRILRCMFINKGTITKLAYEVSIYSSTPASFLFTFNFSFEVTFKGTSCTFSTENKIFSTAYIIRKWRKIKVKLVKNIYFDSLFYGSLIFTKNIMLVSCS